MQSLSSTPNINLPSPPFPLVRSRKSGRKVIASKRKGALPRFSFFPPLRASHGAITAFSIVARALITSPFIVCDFFQVLNHCRTKSDGSFVPLISFMRRPKLQTGNVNPVLGSQLLDVRLASSTTERFVIINSLSGIMASP